MSIYFLEEAFIKLAFIFYTSYKDFLACYIVMSAEYEANLSFNVQYAG